MKELSVSIQVVAFSQKTHPTLTRKNRHKKENADLTDICMCTVHSFPTCIKHCIQCARIEYEYLFKVFINEERNTQGK